MDDPNIALYKWEMEETKQCYFFRDPPTHFVVQDKVLYVYLQISPSMLVTPMFSNKFAILYEPMEEWVVKDLIWHGLPILELAPKTTTSSQPERDMCQRICVVIVRKDSGM